MCLKFEVVCYNKIMTNTCCQKILNIKNKMKDLCNYNIKNNSNIEVNIRNNSNVMVTYSMSSHLQHHI